MELRQGRRYQKAKERKRNWYSVGSPYITASGLLFPVTFSATESILKGYSHITAWSLKFSRYINNNGDFLFSHFGAPHLWIRF